MSNYPCPNCQHTDTQIVGRQLRCVDCDTLYRHPLYFIWKSMLYRCYNPNHDHYCDWGGRGIEVCSEWKNSFDAFAHDILDRLGVRPSPTHTLDRKNTNGNYEIGNVRWATRKEQQNNTRRTHAYRRSVPETSIIAYEGTSMTLAEFANKTGLELEIVKDRYARHPTMTDHILAHGFDRRDHLYQGHYYSVMEMSIFSGIDYGLLNRRLTREKWSPERALAGASINSKVWIDIKDIDCDGVEIGYGGSVVSLRQLSEKTRISLNVLKTRYSRNKSTEWLTSQDYEERIYEYAGIMYTGKELAIINGIDYHTVMFRRNKLGWTVRESAETPGCIVPDLPLDEEYLSNIVVTYEGRDVSLLQLSGITKIPLKTLHYRAACGAHIEWLTGTGFRNRDRVYQGIAFSLPEISYTFDIPYLQLKSRIQRKTWSIEKIITTPFPPRRI